MAALAAVGPPNPRADPECCSILHGLVATVEALCKITEYQHEARTTLMENAERVGNRGRIICITNAKRWGRWVAVCVLRLLPLHGAFPGIPTRVAGSFFAQLFVRALLTLSKVLFMGSDSKKPKVSKISRFR